MDSMDNFCERFESLKQQMKVMGTHTRMVERRLRWWCGIACSLLILGLLSWTLPSSKAQDDTSVKGQGELVERSTTPQPQQGPKDTLTLAVPDELTKALASQKGPLWWQTPLVSALAVLLAAFIPYLILKKQLVAQQRTLTQQEKLKRLESQISDFYGPLLALTQAGEKLWEEFCREQKRSSTDFFEKRSDGSDGPPTAENIESYKRVVQAVFTPINERRERLVFEHAARVEEAPFPEVLVNLVAHVAEFRSVMGRWNTQHSAADALEAYKKDGKEVFQPRFPYPAQELKRYSTQTFQQLTQARDALLRVLDNN